MTDENNEQDVEQAKQTPGKLPGEGTQPVTQRVNEPRPQGGGDTDSAAVGDGPSGGADTGTTGGDADSSATGAGPSGGGESGSTGGGGDSSAEGAGPSGGA